MKTEAPEAWRELARIAGDVSQALVTLEMARKTAMAAFSEDKARLLERQATIARALRLMASGRYLVERHADGSIVVVHGEDGQSVEIASASDDADGHQMELIPGGDK